jgi:hypothetical protein
MNDYLRQIAYNEGCKAYIEDYMSILDNPYEGVSDILASMWHEGYWDMWYSE